MLIAIIAAVVALLIAAVIVAVIFSVRARTKTPSIGVKKNVSSIQSVGVSSSLGNGPRAGSGGRKAGVAHQPAANPAEGLKSRFLAMGVLTAAVFGSLAARLWSMQVMSSSVYEKEAEANVYTTVKTPAPRGYICDADGRALVRNRSSLTVLADPDVADDHDVVQRLSTVLGVPFNVIRQRIQDSTSHAQSQRVVASDARMRDIAFIAEHSDAFSGVTVETRTVREYPYGALAAHVLGYTGSVSDETFPEGRDVESDDEVGKSGIEKTYDNLLAGDHGERKVIADADGNIREVVSETQPTKGSDVYLTIKGPVQYACDKALAELVAPEDGAIGSGTGTGAAAVIMDARDGGIVAMSSFPTFSPEEFIGGISQDVYDVYQSDDAYNPLFNRVIGGEYPAASTYKAFTGLAALDYGFANSTKSWVCTGSWDGWNTGSPQKCWLHSGHGTLGFRSGVVQSCDVVFYDIAKQFWDAGEAGSISTTAMQDEIKKYRFGEATGIDLDAESVGRVPTPEWKAEYFRDTPEAAQWQGGDSTNMVIGQGYVLTTPLQIAVAYGAVATGKIMKPHLLKEVRNSTGDVVASFEAEVVSEPDIPSDNLDFMRDALHGVATDNAEIATLFNAHGIDAACKTGTAEVAGKDDFAWFACYAPYDDPKYIVACVVEEGGGGSAVGAPLGVELLASVLAYDEGTLADMGSIAGSTGKTVARKSSGSTGRTD